MTNLTCLTIYSITKKDVINALNELRDQNNIWKREGSDTFFSKSSTILHTYFSNTPIITEGYFKLAFEVEKNLLLSCIHMFQILQL